MPAEVQRVGRTRGEVGGDCARQRISVGETVEYSKGTADAPPDMSELTWPGGVDISTTKLAR